MDFQLTDEQIMFRDMAKDFILREVVPSIIERDREEKFPHEIMKKMGDQDLLSLMAPKEYGGLEANWLTLGVVSEQMAYYDFSVASNFLIATTLQIMPILMGGDEIQKKKFIQPITRGEMIGCFGAVEPNVGSDATAIETSAVLDGDEWVLNGNKTWITNADVSDFAIVLAQTDKSKGHRGITAFIVEKGTPGFSTTKIANKLGIRSTDTGQLFFRDCRIPQSNQLGAIGKGIQIALTCIEHTRYGISCMAVGVTQACIDASVKYCQERKQFGKAIGSYQLVQERIAEMVVDCEASRWLSYHVGYLKDKKLSYSKETAIAKYHNMEVAAKASRTALELHGAYGFTDDFPIERFYRDMIGPLIFGGTAHVQKMIIGRYAVGIDAFSR